MSRKTKIATPRILTLVAAIAFALAPTAASAGSISDSIFSWPTDYKDQRSSEAVSTFDGKTEKPEIKTPSSTDKEPDKAGQNKTRQ